MADIMKHPRVYQFLHVPVQSGSNDVLDKMNREYTVEEFNEVCDFLKDEMPTMTLATDIICGFPTEDANHHEETCAMVRRHQFPVLNISQFYPRPGTVAAKWKQINTQDKKARSQEITTIFNSYSTNGHFVGTEQLVWIMGFDDRVPKKRTALNRETSTDQPVETLP
jgi:threonylcarbamoyladenosine tRNA methylthiotransferase CDKAL1